MNSLINELIQCKLIELSTLLATERLYCKFKFTLKDIECQILKDKLYNDIIEQLVIDGCTTLDKAIQIISRCIETISISGETDTDCLADAEKYYNHAAQCLENIQNIIAQQSNKSSLDRINFLYDDYSNYVLQYNKFIRDITP